MLDLQKELNALKTKVAELESRIVAEPVKWQPKGGDWYIGGGGKVFCYTARNIDFKEFGTERKTQEQTQRAAVEMRRFNRLLALRDELCGDEVVNFNNNAFKYYLYFNHADKSWYIDFNDEHEVIMPYFTTRESAQKACDMLNIGEVQL